MNIRQINRLGLAHKTGIKVEMTYVGGLLLFAVVMGMFVIHQGRMPGEKPDWMGFSANAAGKHVQLAWETARENESEFYQIERSFDGLTYEGIGQVQAAGSSIQTSHYSFYDMGAHKIEKPIAYYRVKLVAPNGAFHFSQVIAFDLNHHAPISIEATHRPELGELKVRYASLDDETLDMRMVNASGKVVLRKDLALHSGSGEMSVDVSDWNSGVYYVQVYNNTTTKMEKLVLR